MHMPCQEDVLIETQGEWIPVVPRPYFFNGFHGRKRSERRHHLSSLPNDNKDNPMVPSSEMKIELNPFSASEISQTNLKKQRKTQIPFFHGLSKLQHKIDTNIFEFYLETLWKKLPEDKQRSCTYLDCLWFHLYGVGSSSTKVLDWVRRKHIFSRKYVFVPIIRWRHWSLLILCHLGEDLDSKERTPCLLLLDSLRMAEPRRLEPDIRKFVWDIYKSEGGKESKEIVSRIPLLVPKVPQQRDEKQCGMFVLQFIDLFLQNAPENFCPFKGYPYFLKEDWFDPKDIESFCKDIHSFSLRRWYNGELNLKFRLPEDSSSIFD
ncbi:hypothetical protein AMTR_s00049p00094540 [Amborella trichopoda]|uniref:Ubiquitin-like protease family profile domain-containing protein n=2 Tax=Amborella trichopoda TaxID=13333 RepID=W1PZN3_AMBTC|nr:hypothetical protein AMTR_s00049p00094540 [Amborella trichopoda]